MLYMSTTTCAQPRQSLSPALPLVWSITEGPRARTQRYLAQQQQQQQQQTDHTPRATCQASGKLGWCSRATASIAAIAAAPLLLLAPLADAALPAVKDPASNVGYLTNKEVDRNRKRANFVRAYDGHVSIQNKYTKAWTDIKCDLQVPGLLLLRDAGGEVYYLGYAGLKQVDLSDDQVVAAIARDDWENSMIPVEAPGEGEVIERLEMTREGFYQLVSLTSGEDYAAEEQQQQQQQQQDPAQKR